MTANLRRNASVEYTCHSSLAYLGLPHSYAFVREVRIVHEWLESLRADRSVALDDPKLFAAAIRNHTTLRAAISEALP